MLHVLPGATNLGRVFIRTFAKEKETEQSGTGQGMHSACMTCQHSKSLISSFTKEKASEGLGHERQPK